MIPYNVLISCFIYIRPVPTILLYTVISVNLPPSCVSQYNPLISCNLILLSIQYHFEKSPLIEWFHTMYGSDLSFVSDLSLQSDYTLPFSKKKPPHCESPYISSISCNLILLILHYYLEKSPFLIYFIQSIDQLFHVHQICPYNQNLYYHFWKVLFSL